MKNAIVFMAHTDDEHGMSGTIFKMARLGVQIHLVITTSSKNHDERKAEMALAAEVLGVSSIHYLGEPDGKLEVRQDVIDRFNKLVDGLPKPDTVFTMSPIDVHPDHRRTADLTFARYFQRGVNVPIYLYALNSSGRAFDYVRPQTIAFHPTHYVNVSDVVEVIKRADSHHLSQDASVMWKGVEANLLGRAVELRIDRDLKRLGSDITHAEAFVDVTRLPAMPDFLMMLMEYTNLNRTKSIPFPVTREAVGFTS